MAPLRRDFKKSREPTLPNLLSGPGLRLEFEWKARGMWNHAAPVHADTLSFMIWAHISPAR